MSSPKGPDRMTSVGLTKRELASVLGCSVAEINSNGPVPQDPDVRNMNLIKFMEKRVQSEADKLAALASLKQNSKSNSKSNSKRGAK